VGFDEAGGAATDNGFGWVHSRSPCGLKRAVTQENGTVVFGDAPKRLLHSRTAGAMKIDP
jgi:hypothetical protein